MRLPTRLKRAASYLTNTDAVADIGSDHGLLPIYLSTKGFTRLYASDNKLGPYRQLIKNISRANCQKNVRTALKNGLTDLPDDIDTIVIAGMGGDLIKQILNKSKEITKRLKKMILLPNNNELAVRLWLNENGFKIAYEEIVFDDKFYEIIVAIKGYEEMNLEMKMFGPRNLQGKSDLFIKKWEQRKIVVSALLTDINLPVERRLDLTIESQKIESILKGDVL